MVSTWMCEIDRTTTSLTLSQELENLIHFHDKCLPGLHDNMCNSADCLQYLFAETLFAETLFAVSLAAAADPGASAFE